MFALKPLESLVAECEVCFQVRETLQLHPVLPAAQEVIHPGALEPAVGQSLCEVEGNCQLPGMLQALIVGLLVLLGPIPNPTPDCAHWLVRWRSIRPCGERVTPHPGGLIIRRLDHLSGAWTLPRATPAIPS